VFQPSNRYVLLNLNELRHRNILTDATLVVGSHHLQAHCAVLMITLDPSSVSLLLDFMYTSRLPLTPSIAPGVLAVATYLQMDHVAQTCRDFILHWESMGSRQPHLELVSRVCVTSAAQDSELPHPALQLKLPVSGPIRYMGKTKVFVPLFGHKIRSLLSFLCCRIQVEGGESMKPTSQSESKEPNIHTDTLLSPEHMQQEPCGRDKMTISCFTSDSRASLDPKACNWKKYKYIILNPLLTDAVKEEEQCPAANRTAPKTRTPVEAWPGEVPGQINRLHAQVSTIKRQMHKLKCKTKTSTYIVHLCAAERPYRCNVCGAQFNRPANLKTHARIHSGEKPYRCDTCGARFVQVAHLRAHVLIHTGEKPYPCHTCGTRFRHLQTLKSHLRIHTGEKPYSCEKCDLHFRHKSQLRLHLRQKHGAITNTKIRYKILTEPYQPLLQTC
uniref:C2H2-type domain-containing protein n=1 Tax=Periophthalmus magnuspinnatus TaxID=409849 RepID=A0A3B3ZLF7_9GOBI